MIVCLLCLDYELISAETVMNPLQIYVGDDVTDMDFDDKMYFVFTLRLLALPLYYYIAFFADD